MSAIVGERRSASPLRSAGGRRRRTGALRRRGPCARGRRRAGSRRAAGRARAGRPARRRLRRPRSTRSSASSTSSAPPRNPRRCAHASRRATPNRWCSTARPAPGRPRSRDSSPVMPAPSSRSSRRWRWGARRSARCSPARRTAGCAGLAPCCSSMRSTASTRLSRTRSCRPSRTAPSPSSAPRPRTPTSR